MPLTINTNISSLIAQRNLNGATNALNTSIERMTTGYKINKAQDNAAGCSIANMWVTQLGSLDVASDNAATGADMLTTAEETYSLLTGHLQRVRDLTEQAANGTYGSQSLRAIQAEIHARLQEVSRIAANSEFNGIKLMAFNMDETGNENVGLTKDGVNLQIGLYADKDSQINLAIDLFKNASVSGLFKGMSTQNKKSSTTFENLIKAASGGTVTVDDSTGVISVSGGDIDLTKIGSADGLQAFAAACAGMVYKNDGTTATLSLQTSAGCGAKEMLAYLDDAIDDISDRVTQIGAAQNRVSSAMTALDVQAQNLTSSLSTLRDTDVAKESSNYLQAQILQQASATLLSTANQLPSIALNLI